MRSDYDFLKCSYSFSETENFLIRSVKEHFSSKDCQHILKALEVAQQAHSNQLRDNGDPYIVHPMRVAMMLLFFEPGLPVNVFIAALLHDTLEDTSLKASDISDNFGNHVLLLVSSVTRKHGTESLQEKQQAKFDMWKKIMQAGHETRAIKTFDALDNMICWKTIPPTHSARAKIPRWLREAQTMSLPLARITNSKAYDMLKEQYSYYERLGYEHQPITR